MQTTTRFTTETPMGLRKNTNMTEIKEYDEKGNLIRHRHPDGFESWMEYDTKGNLIHRRDSDGFEAWREYDANNNLINYRNNDGIEENY